MNELRARFLKRKAEVSEKILHRYFDELQEMITYYSHNRDRRNMEYVGMAYNMLGNIQLDIRETRCGESEEDIMSALEKINSCDLRLKEWLENYYNKIFPAHAPKKCGV